MDRYMYGLLEGEGLSTAESVKRTVRMYHTVLKHQEQRGKGGGVMKNFRVIFAFGVATTPETRVTNEPTRETRTPR